MVGLGLVARGFVFVVVVVVVTVSVPGRFGGSVVLGFPAKLAFVLMHFELSVDLYLPDQPPKEAQSQRKQRVLNLRG